MALVAVGGYGRGELAPFSDIDLLFLLPYKETPHTEQVVEYMLYLLWDLGLKVGQATRSVDEMHRAAPRATSRSAPRCSKRATSGASRRCSLELKRRFEAEVIKGSGAQFVEAKLAERDERHARLGDSRYLVEPNVKEGKGGLRDLHTLFWIAKYIYRVDDVDRAGRARRAHRRGGAALRARAEFPLDACAAICTSSPGRAEDRLTFDLPARDRPAHGLRRPRRHAAASSAS